MVQIAVMKPDSGDASAAIPRDMERGMYTFQEKRNDQFITVQKNKQIYYYQGNCDSRRKVS
jgi:hypothetical protein